MAALAATQVQPRVASAFFAGQQLRVQRSAVVARVARPSCVVAAAVDDDERLRLNNLSPQEGSRKNRNRKGRGYGAGQGGTAGFGMRGQKSRSGSGIRPGFEGGQTPLYRRLPKLKGIAGGMGAGLPDFVVVNLSQLSKFAEGEEVSLETLEAKRVLNISGRETRLPLKVLGTGELTTKLVIKATAFSASAREKIEASGSQIVELPAKITWTRKAHEARVKAAAAAK